MSQLGYARPWAPWGWVWAGLVWSLVWLPLIRQDPGHPVAPVSIVRAASDARFCGFCVCVCVCRAPETPPTSVPRTAGPHSGCAPYTGRDIAVSPSLRRTHNN